MEIGYALARTSPKELVWEKTIASSHTAGMSDSVVSSASAGGRASRQPPTRISDTVRPAIALSNPPTVDLHGRRGMYGAHCSGLSLLSSGRVAGFRYLESYIGRAHGVDHRFFPEDREDLDT